MPLLNPDEVKYTDLALWQYCQINPEGTRMVGCLNGDTRMVDAYVFDVQKQAWVKVGWLGQSLENYQKYLDGKGAEFLT